MPSSAVRGTSSGPRRQRATRSGSYGVRRAVSRRGLVPESCSPFGTGCSSRLRVRRRRSSIAPCNCTRTTFVCPDDGLALENLSWYLKHVGRWIDSEAPALQALQTGYATPRLYDELVLAQLAAGKFTDAQRSLGAWRDRFGPSQLWYRDAFRLAAAKRDYEAGDSLTSEATRDRTWNVRPGRLPIATLAIRGRLREAEALYAAAMATHDQAGNHG